MHLSPCVCVLTYDLHYILLFILWKHLKGQIVCFGHPQTLVWVLLVNIQWFLAGGNVWSMGWLWPWHYADSGKLHRLQSGRNHGAERLWRRVLLLCPGVWEGAPKVANGSSFVGFACSFKCIVMNPNAASRPYLSIKTSLKLMNIHGWLQLACPELILCCGL